MPSAVLDQTLDGCRKKIPLLDQRFAQIKRSLVSSQHKAKVIASYERLCKVLETEANHITRNGPAIVPEIDFDDVCDNGGALPQGFVDLVRDRGCVILRNVVSEAQATTWEADLKEYTRCHHEAGGFPRDDPQTWNLWWTPTQVQIRSHERVMKAMDCVSKLWHVADDSLPIDLTSQVVYPDRFRIRHPSKDAEFTLPAHLDSGGIERWECSINRSNFQAIFEGDWDSWDGWAADRRYEAKSDLYDNGAACSCWRSLQGWLSLSHTSTGEGTLRLLPSLKASVAYIMLRPLFAVDETFDDTQPIFPGATPGNTQFFPSREFHPHLLLERSMIGIPPVRPGDYVFWHCDLVHEVDRFHPGSRDSSVVYNACIPLTPYNVESLVGVRDAFQKAAVPKDFACYDNVAEEESQHTDHGARRENVLSHRGLRALGLEPFDDLEEGLTDGQRAVRRLANEALAR
ncbi:hypothetical protein H2204_005566 [Knufia peltigerae]|uniref:DUF1479 domain protein n=1 Tax=Knufia peltigerae TaxID=1002370 RepID=A0AA38Y5B3_9EURO|nr:hypothetical protein H2204_005566 [Knufia peltigerae]